MDNNIPERIWLFENPDHRYKWGVSEDEILEIEYVLKSSADKREQIALNCNKVLRDIIKNLKKG